MLQRLRIGCMSKPLLVVDSGVGFALRILVIDGAGRSNPAVPLAEHSTRWPLPRVLLMLPACLELRTAPRLQYKSLEVEALFNLTSRVQAYTSS